MKIKSGNEEMEVLLYLLHTFTSSSNYENDFFREKIEIISQFLIANDAEINIFTKNEDSPLHYFSSLGFCDLAENFDAKMFENRNTSGWTCLHFAAECGQYNMIKLIMKKSKDLQKFETNSGKTAVCLAKEFGFPKCASLIESASFGKKEKCVKFQDQIESKISSLKISSPKISIEELEENWDKYDEPLLLLNTILSGQG